MIRRQVERAAGVGEGVGNAETVGSAGVALVEGGVDVVGLGRIEASDGRAGEDERPGAVVCSELGRVPRVFCVPA